MRRKDRELTTSEDIRDIIAKCKTCHLAMIDGILPYVVPLSYGFDFEGGVLTLYFHSAKEGRKLDVLHKNSAVCFNLCVQGDLHEFESPCNAGYYFESVTGTGRVEFIEDFAEKARALTQLMEHQSGREFFFTEAQVNTVCVYKVVSSNFTAKRKKRPQSAG